MRLAQQRVLFLQRDVPALVQVAVRRHLMPLRHDALDDVRVVLGVVAADEDGQGMWWRWKMSRKRGMPRFGE